MKDVDLTPLEPYGDRGALERSVARVLRAVAPELARRQRAAGVWGIFALWRWPILTASGALAVAALVLLALTPVTRSSATSLAEAAGVPREWARWAGAGQTPTPGALLDLAGGKR